MIFKDKKVSFLAVIVSNILVLCFFTGFYVLAQFYVPLDNSPNSQTKEGGLILNNGGAVNSNGLIVKNGNVGIGIDGSLNAQLVIGGSGTLILTPRATAPTGAQGLIYYDGSENVFKYNTGSEWKDLAAGSGTPTIPSGTIAGTFELYYWQDGTARFAGCRASWGQADCNISGRCKSGYHSQIMMYGTDHTGPGEYPGASGQNGFWHVELYGCIKD